MLLYLFYTVSETGKSSESMLPKSLSMASSIGTVVEVAAREKGLPRLSIASTRGGAGVKHLKNRKVSLFLCTNIQTIHLLVVSQEKRLKTIARPHIVRHFIC